MLLYLYYKIQTETWKRKANISLTFPTSKYLKRNSKSRDRIQKGKLQELNNNNFCTDDKIRKRICCNYPKCLILINGTPFVLKDVFGFLALFSPSTNVFQDHAFGRGRDANVPEIYYFT